MESSCESLEMINQRLKLACGRLEAVANQPHVDPGYVSKNNAARGEVMPEWRLKQLIARAFQRQRLDVARCVHILENKARDMGKEQETLKQLANAQDEHEFVIRGLETEQKRKQDRLGALEHAILELEREALNDQALDEETLRLQQHVREKENQVRELHTVIEELEREEETHREIDSKQKRLRALKEQLEQYKRQAELLSSIPEAPTKEEAPRVAREELQRADNEVTHALHVKENELDGLICLLEKRMDQLGQFSKLGLDKWGKVKDCSC